jgi:hypothetical protein
MLYFSAVPHYAAVLREVINDTRLQ